MTETMGDVDCRLDLVLVILVYILALRKASELVQTECRANNMP